MMRKIIEPNYLDVSSIWTGLIHPYTHNSFFTNIVLSTELVLRVFFIYFIFLLFPVPSPDSGIVTDT